MKLKVSSSVAPFREKAEKVWGLERYQFPQDILKPVLFFGFYHIGDYLSYLLHLGDNSVFWCGCDILNLKKNKWLKFWLRNIDNYCENGVERDALLGLGIEAEIRPSFLEDVDDFPVSFKPMDKPQVFISCNKDRELEYGVNTIMRIANKVPEVIFHIYGSEALGLVQNLYFHGRVPPEQFNEEIKGYHAGLRLNEFDGFSEIIAKSVLMGQYPISRIKYPYIDSYETEDELIALLKGLKNKKEPNIAGRDYWRKNVNNYDWNRNKQ